MFENASETSESSKSKRQTLKVQPFLFFLQSLDIQVLSWRIQLGGFGSSRLATVAGKWVGGPSEEEDIHLQ